MTEDELAQVPSTPLKSFAQAELVACEKCLRANPPTRSNCLYCGADLPGAVATRAADAREETASEELAHAVFLAAFDSVISGEACSSLASLLNLKLEDVKAGAEAGGPLPLIAPSDFDREKRIVAAITDLGMRALIVSRADLDAITLRKIRALEWSDVVINRRPQAQTSSEHRWNDVEMIVVGRVFTTRVEVDEKRRGARSTTIDSRQFTSDESAADVYFKGEEGWRIAADNFDYSCLGEQKAATGFENFTRLLDVFREHAPHAMMDESYMRKRGLLANVWPLTEDARNSVSFGRGRKFKQSTTVTNETQFDNYSKAAYILRAPAPERAK